MIQNCHIVADLVNNAEKDQLDYTFEYQRAETDTLTTFVIENEYSILGVTVDWIKKGRPSIECTIYHDYFAHTY